MPLSYPPPPFLPQTHSSFRTTLYLSFFLDGFPEYTLSFLILTPISFGHLLWKCQHCHHLKHDFVCVRFLSPLLEHGLFDPCVISGPLMPSTVPNFHGLGLPTII